MKSAEIIFLPPKRPEGEITKNMLESSGSKPGVLDALKEESFGFKSLGDKAWALILPKTTLYSRNAGYDNMVFIARENGMIGNISELSAKQLNDVLKYAGEIMETYRDEAEKGKTPLQLEAISISFHKNPVSQDVFQKKLHAQTLKNLHLHVVGFNDAELDGDGEVGKREVPKKNWRNIYDPFLDPLARLSRNKAFCEKYYPPFSMLTPGANTGMNGFGFDAKPDAIYEKKFAEDLIGLHNAFVALYHEISDLFVNERNSDEKGMPRLRKMEEREKRIGEFLKKFEGEYENKDDEVFVAKWVRRINRLMVGSVEASKKEPVPEKENIFLRGPAYTLSLLKQTKSERLLVNLSPRIMSYGNLLDDLGLVKEVAPDEFGQEWKLKRERMEEKLRERFKHSQEPLRKAA